jgi:LysR family hydrogen peroxide-inducible transcriptional activator
MEIHQLRYFVAVAEERSFSRAAAREHVAQPSLSQQIQKLEGNVGERLFDRLPRSVVLTEAGECLLDYARKVLLEIANAQRCVQDLKRDVSGRLIVGAIFTIAPYVLPALIEKSQHRYPKVTLEIFEDTTENLALRLEDGTLDIAMVSTCNETPTLHRDSLGNEPLLLLLSKNISWQKGQESSGAISSLRNSCSCMRCIVYRRRFLIFWRPIIFDLNSRSKVLNSQR